MSDATTKQNRKAFEAWYVDFFQEPLPKWFQIVHMWECWKAARATLPQRDEPVAEGQSTAEELLTEIRTALNASGVWHLGMSTVEVIKLLVASSTSPVAEGQASAWITEDGDRVVTEKTMAAARKDGGALLSSLRVYSVALYTTPPSPSLREVRADALARKFHETYERLAPSFGYETRKETRAFDPGSPNGRLMIAVCAELARLEGGKP